MKILKIEGEFFSQSEILLFIHEKLSCAEISKVQDDEVGDGTTSVVVLACELLKVTSQLTKGTSPNNWTTIRPLSIVCGQQGFQAPPPIIKPDLISIVVKLFFYLIGS